MSSIIWLIGGTSDSATISEMLTAASIPFIVTVTTPDARALYPSIARVVVGCMNESKMQAFCQQHQIAAVIDASHPYAVEVSTGAIAITTKLTLPYLRYERGSCHTEKTKLITELNSFDTLLTGNYLTGQRALLTVGCKALPLFHSWQNRTTLFARVLPKISSLETALNAGFTSDRLIAIRPPISMATETALGQQWKISLVITKASGKAGGEAIKRQVATTLEIPLIVIARPPLVYPQQTASLSEVLSFCQLRSRQLEC